MKKKKGDIIVVIPEIERPRIETLIQRAGVKTPSQVVSKALRLYEYVVMNIDKPNIINSIGDGILTQPESKNEESDQMEK